MLRRAGSRRDTPVVVEDYNLAAGGRRGMVQTRIDTGSWMHKGKNAREFIGILPKDTLFSLLLEYISYTIGCTCSGLVDDVRWIHSTAATPCIAACFTVCFLKWM
jgi:hypothetical protein